MVNSFLFILSLFSSSLVFSNTIIVDTTGTGNYTTIQEGINASTDGDTVLVHPGTYVENINYNGKNIVLGSLFLTTQDTTYIYQTIIDGNHDWGVVIFENGEDSLAILSGFTITNGFCDAGAWPTYIGGGITCKNYSSPILENLRISNNDVWSYYGTGGGILCYEYSNPKLRNVSIFDNLAGTGGGITCGENSNPSMVNMSISNNSVIFNGGGIICAYNSSPSLVNVEIVNNMATGCPWQDGLGGGILCAVNSNPNMINVTISGNSADFGGGILCADSSHINLTNSILWNDFPEEIYFYSDYEPCSITITYSDVQNGIEGIVTNYNGTVNWLEGNIDEDPMFVDTLNNNYQLQQGSPCINAGTIDTTGLNLPKYDLAGNPRISGGRIDMGAYEWQDTQAVDDWQNQSTDNVLFQNHPNPFSNSTTISFNLNTLLSIPMMFEREIYLDIFNIKGQLVRTLSLTTYQSTTYQSPLISIVWDGTDEDGNKVSSGEYFYKLNCGEYSVAKKMLLIR